MSMFQAHLSLWVYCSSTLADVHVSWNPNTLTCWATEQEYIFRNLEHSQYFPWPIPVKLLRVSRNTFFLKFEGKCIHPMGSGLPPLAAGEFCYKRNIFCSYSSAVESLSYKYYLRRIQPVVLHLINRNLACYV